MQGFKPSLRTPGNPLREFKGTLDGWASEKVTYGTRESINIIFSFKDVEVIESVEPYPFPIASIAIRYTPPSDRGRAGQGNRWEVFATSMRKLFGQEADLDKLVGKVQTWKMMPGTLRLPMTDEDGNPVMMDDPNNPGQQVQQWGDQQDDCWTIAEVEGEGSVKEADLRTLAHLVGLADGKDERGFYEAALQDPQVTGNPSIVQSITDRVILDTLLTAELLTRDTEGIFHKVP